MTAQKLDGKKLSASIEATLKQAVGEHIAAGGHVPALSVILVGDDPASVRYVSHKVAACERIGIDSRCYRFPPDTPEATLMALIDELNADERVNGILLQCPLPDRRPVFPLLARIHPDKDVDGLHPYNQGCLLSGSPSIRSCTPWGIMQLLKHHDLDISGKHVVLVGASSLVGRPLALECLLADATPSIAHRYTQNLKELVTTADVLVSAVGKRGVIDASWVKLGAIVIDVGMNLDDSGSLCGDLDVEVVSKRASWLTPVPGGVGPMTVITLMQNTCHCARILDTV